MTKTDDAKADAGEKIEEIIWRRFSWIKDAKKIDARRWAKSVAEECCKKLRTLPLSASKPVTVEEIALEIDPDAFSLMDLRGPNGWSTRTERYAERVDKATSLATAILSLINARTSGVER